MLLKLFSLLLLATILLVSQNSFAQKHSLAGTYQHKLKAPPKKDNSIISSVHIISHFHQGELILHANKRFQLTYPYFHAWQMCQVTATYKGKYHLEGDTLLLQTVVYDNGARKKSRVKHTQTFPLLLLPNGTLQLLEYPYEYYQRESPSPTKNTNISLL